MSDQNRSRPSHTPSPPANVPDPDHDQASPSEPLPPPRRKRTSQPRPKASELPNWTPTSNPQRPRKPFPKPRYRQTVHEVNPPALLSQPPLPRWPERMSDDMAELIRYRHGREREERAFMEDLGRIERGRLSMMVGRGKKQDDDDSWDGDDDENWEWAGSLRKFQKENEGGGGQRWRAGSSDVVSWWGDGGDVEGQEQVQGQIHAQAQAASPGPVGGDGAGGWVYLARPHAVAPGHTQAQTPAAPAALGGDANSTLYQHAIAHGRGVGASVGGYPSYSRAIGQAPIQTSTAPAPAPAASLRYGHTATTRTPIRPSEYQAQRHNMGFATPRTFAPTPAVATTVTATSSARGIRSADRSEPASKKARLDGDEDEDEDAAGQRRQ